MGAIAIREAMASQGMGRLGVRAATMRPVEPVPRAMAQEAAPELAVGAAALGVACPEKPARAAVTVAPSRFASRIAPGALASSKSPANASIEAAPIGNAAEIAVGNSA